jgi:membrane-associated phospholipid phosphatase
MWWQKRGSRVPSQRLSKLVTVLVVLLSVGLLRPVQAHPEAQDTNTQLNNLSAQWPTWVLESADQFRVDPPPDEAATADEMTQLQAMMSERDEETLQQIAYWNAGPPAYRWNQIALDTILERALPAQAALRHLTLLHVAIYDATVAAWESKYAYNRPRPSEATPSLTTVIPNPAYPSYPSEYAVTAATASALLSWLFPEDVQRFEALAQEAAHSRLAAGVEYPSDVEAGLELGRQVAQRVIEYGEADRFTAEWTGSIPTDPGYWTGENPAFPMAGTWQTWVLTAPDQFRPAPPPAYDSEQLATEMAELRAFERTPVTNANAMFWEFGAGGRRIHWFWNNLTSQLVLEEQWDDNAPVAARAYALTNIAGYDSLVACWDAKYAYWAMRPFQLDAEFSPVFATPNHPSYPSAHSCISSVMTTVLATLFPANAERVKALAVEAGESRISGGIHFRSDVEAGLALGENVAQAVLAHLPHADT